MQNENFRLMPNYSQAHTLHKVMQSQGIKHGERVLADLTSVLIGEDEPYRTMWFCGVGLLIHRILEQSTDLVQLPYQCSTDLDLPIVDCYGGTRFNLKNIELYCNGTIQIIKTSETVFEPLEI